MNTRFGRGMELLACPACHHGLDASGMRLNCPQCAFATEMRDGVVLGAPEGTQSFFDDKFSIMEQGHNPAGGEWKFCYEKQVAFLEQALTPGSVVLDIGCGPALPYRRRTGCFHIGLEYSLPSIRANQDLDLRLHGSAYSIPLRSESVDIIVCFYSIHHMIGQTIRDNREYAARAFAEFRRVVKPGGQVLVFEMIPWRPAWFAEQMIWNTAKQVLGPKLDMHFWSDRTLMELARPAFTGATWTERAFHAPALLTFPPVFSLPRLKIPRMLYPLTPKLHHWCVAPG